MPSASYKTLTIGQGRLKWATTGTQAGTAALTPADVLAAEATAKARVDEFILQTAGAVTGLVIVQEFTAADEADVDPIVRDLAGLLAVAILLDEWDKRNKFPQGAPAWMQGKSEKEKALEEANAVAYRIAASGKTMKADGLSIRRWRGGRLEDGPVVGGPFSKGSMFDQRGIYTDPSGVLRRTPGVPLAIDVARRCYFS